MRLEGGGNVVTLGHDDPETSTRAASPGPRVALEGVSKSWDRGRQQVLHGVDLVLPPGALVSLVGANGAGKTTLLRIVAGLIAPDEGRVAVDGLDPVSDRRRYQQRIGFVPAGQSGLYARFSVRDHLEYWARLAFLPRAARGPAIERATEAFALEPILAQRADRLSMGQRQRVRLALGFLHGPRVVLLDEPRNSLDEDGSAALYGALTAFLEEGGTAIWCAPSADEIELPVDVALTLAHGRVTAR